MKQPGSINFHDLFWAGAVLFLEGMGVGIFLNNMQDIKNIKASGRTYLEVKTKRNS
jgi:hypothetical protein